MKYDYNEIVKEIVSDGRIDSTEIFNFEFAPQKQIYEKFFHFCQENLSEKCTQYDIHPARFVFRNSLEVNARAGKCGKFNLIMINCGSIHVLSTFFETFNKSVLDSASLSRYKNLDNKLDVTVNHLLFQTSILFTYYHELAHLIQKPTFSSKMFEELYSMSGGSLGSSKNIEMQVYEFDADIFASQFICFHLVDYWKKLNNNDRTTENLTLLLSVGLTSLFSLFLFYSDGHFNIYFDDDKFEHPHPLIRILYISDCLINCVKSQNFDVEIEPEFSAKIIQEAINFSDYLFKGNDKYSFQMAQFYSQFISNTDKIYNYQTNILIEKAKSMSNLILNRNFNP